jgi:HSP20 family protein
MRFDPFRELDRLTRTIGGAGQTAMPMDAYRQGDEFIVHFDLPGIDPSSIDLTVEKNVLTLSAQRTWQPDENLQIIASERPQGTFSRQLFLGESLDVDRVAASYEHGVLTVKIPVAEQAKPRRVEVEAAGRREAIGAGAGANGS